MQLALLSGAGSRTLAGKIQLARNFLRSVSSLAGDLDAGLE